MTKGLIQIQRIQAVFDLQDYIFVMSLLCHYHVIRDPRDLVPQFLSGKLCQTYATVQSCLDTWCDVIGNVETFESKFYHSAATKTLFDSISEGA